MDTGLNGQSAVRVSLNGYEELNGEDRHPPREITASREMIDESDGMDPTMSSFFFQAEDGIRDHCVTGVPDVCSSDLSVSLDCIVYWNSPLVIRPPRLMFWMPR